MAQNCTKIHEAAPSFWKQSISGWKASSIGAPAGSTKDQSGREANIAAAWLQATPHSGKRELNPKLNESAWKQEDFSLPVLTLLSLCWCQSHTTHQQLLSSVDWERRSPLLRHTRDSVSPGPSHHSRSFSSRVSVVCHGSTGAWGRGRGLRTSLTFTVKAKINLKIMNLSNLPGHTYLLLSR